ncbi:kinesin-like protein KIN-12F [Vicia villosa]|uniref:kinesin-like protein KIN-12F n=1 Tax=Vicia villosa TaxID=3911 RepID=UPI00273B63B1|nr:kinesin-like protein KIN-12F [Vicia villosa]
MNMKQKISNNNNNPDNGFFGTFSSTSIKKLLPISSFRKPNSSNRNKSNLENIPPIHSNIPITHHQTQLNPKPQFSRNNPHVKVVVRIRPDVKEGDCIVNKVSSDALCVGDKQFKFDEVLDANSNQEDVFQSVGVPLVLNTLAGYNTSVLSYGQSGSGKTYTMWGPPSSMAEDPSCRSPQGIVPRIFQMLFSELERERLVSDQKQFSYKCRCSFLEIYDDQIGDLLNPNQKNLEMKDDPQNGLHVENLIEEYVTCYNDVAQILIKGLSNRKIGATSLNSNSSRSHIIFTFVIESLCKGTTKGCSSLKASRISLIDLAGLDRDRVDNGSSQCQWENRYIEKSLSQLGNLVDALTDKSQRGEDIPRSNSCFTRLLQESLGENAKLSVICSISPDSKSIDETLCTLRFGEQIKSIRNKPSINIIKEADDLSGKIRHLKEELIRAKTDDVHSSVVSKINGCFQGQNARESFNQLKVSLNRSLLLSNLDSNTDEAANVNEDDIRQLHQQFDELDSSCEWNAKDISVSEDGVQFYSFDEYYDEDTTIADENSVGDSISAISCSKSPILDEPPLSESPKFSNSKRKSVAISSSYLGSRNTVEESSAFGDDVLGKSLKHGEHKRASLQSSKADFLAESLQRGLQIIDYHQQNSTLNKSSSSFSFGRLTLTPCPEIDKVQPYDQTLQQKVSNDEVTSTFLCASCSTDLTDKVPNNLENVMAKGNMREKELENVCKEQAARIEQLNQLVEKLKGEKSMSSMKDENKLLWGTSSNVHSLYRIEEKCEIKEVQDELAQRDIFFDSTEKESLLQEIQSLRRKLQVCNDAPVKMSTDKLRSSLMSRSIQLQKSGVFSQDNRNEELENERQRWTEMESDWICLTDELRADLESYRQHAEKLETELNLEKKGREEMDDALKRAVNGHGRMVEHYTDLQEKYDDLASMHDAMKEGISELKKAVTKASKKGQARFAKSLSAELSALRMERERESKLLKKENYCLKIQLRDTAEAVQAAGELLVRLREAEQAAYVAEENFANMRRDNEELKMEVEKLNRKHKTEINTIKQYITESKLPESALKPLYPEDSDTIHNNATSSYAYDDQAWKSEFGAIYQEHY